MLLDYGTPIDEVNALIEEARMETWNDLALADNNSASLRSQFRTALDDAAALLRAKEDAETKVKEEAVVAVAEEPVLVVSGNGADVSESEKDRASKNSMDVVGATTVLEAVSEMDDEEDPDDIYAPPRVSTTIPPSSGVKDPSSDSSGNGAAEKQGPSTRSSPTSTGLTDGDASDGLGLSPA